VIGRTVSHYHIVGQLGAGGMGVVYAAEDHRLGRPVALKFVPEELAKDHQAIERLRTEARTASGLNHANICTIYDIGEYEGRPFIVMELLKGQTLRDRLTAAGPLRIHEAVELGIHVADALDAAHHRGIMHRDIKPANLFLVERGQVKILDFGLAKLVRQPASSTTTGPTRDQTAEGVTLGTVSYMSPEQVTGEVLDGRTDLFSLGVVLYECLTGHQPFTGKTSAVIFSAILTRAPVAPVVFNPELPLRLQDVINNCLEKDRELRYQDAAGLRADLKRVKRDLESGHSGVFRIGAGVTPATGAAGGGMRSGQASPYDSAGRHDSAPRETHATSAPHTTRSVAAIATAAALAVALAIGGAFVLWSRSRTPSELPRGSSQAFVRGRLGLAATSLEAKDYRSAMAYADEALRVAPDEPDARRIRDAARAMITRFDQTTARARERLAAGDTEGATSAINEARSIDPSATTLGELSAELVNQLKSQAESARREGQRARSTPPPPANPPRQAANEPAKLDPPRQRVAKEKEPAPTVATPPPAEQPAPRETAPQSASTPPPAAAVIPPPAPQTAPSTPQPAPQEPAAAPAPPPAPGPSPERREPTPTPTPVETDDAAIRRVVMNYARAIESKDIGLFRRVKPNLSAEEQRRIEDGFRAVTSQQVDMTILSIEPHGDDASVRVRRRDTILAGGRQQTTESQQTMALTRSASGWVIRDIGR
jgi:serine/threonine protein kinase